MIRHNVILSLLAIYLTACQGIQVSLTRMSTLYLPTYGQGGSVSYPFPSATVKELAFEPKWKMIYGVGKGVVHIISAKDAMNLAPVDHFIVPDRELTDVEVCEDGVFITYRDEINKQRGGVLVYDLYDPFAKTMDLLHDIPMGSSPGMVSPTKNCTIVVAIENEGFIQNGVFYDPPGGVGIVRFPSGIDKTPVVKILNFAAFDYQFNQLSKQGVRWVFRGNFNKFSDNIEPEYITFNADYSTAYIGLQENNAIAVVDMATDTITAIHGLGFKLWGELDPSDKDGGVKIKNWPVYGMYQPDSIKFVRWNNQDYIITANEGAAQEYGAPINFAEEIRGEYIDPAVISPNVSSFLVDALQDDAKLGRLLISSVDGKNAQGQFERFYTYGARSFSIWRASDMMRVYDSGSELEKKVATLRRDIFNSDAVPNRKLDKTVDTRSDNKGPETESLAAGELGNHLLIFVGNERSSTIAVYSVGRGRMNPTFQTLFTGTPRDTQRTWKQLFDARELYAIDPQYMRFFLPSDGLANYPVLLVAGGESGTVSTLKVEVTNPTVKECRLSSQCTINQPCSQPRQCYAMDTTACMGSCQHYAVCMYGVYMPIECQSGMYFDELKGRCVKGLCPTQAVTGPSNTLRPVPGPSTLSSKTTAKEQGCPISVSSAANLSFATESSSKLTALIKLTNNMEIATYKVGDTVKIKGGEEGCRLSSQCTINQPCSQCSYDMETRACMDSCQHYAVCIYGVYMPMDCQSGNYFDKLNGRCVSGRCPAQVVPRPANTPLPVPGSTTPRAVPGSNTIRPVPGSSLAQTNHPFVLGASNFFRGLLGLGQAVPPPSSTPRPVPTTTTPRPVPTTTTPRPVPTTTTPRPVPGSSLAQTNHPLVVGASNFFRGLLGLGQAVPPPSSTPRPVPVTTTPRPVPTTTTPRPVPVTTTPRPVPGSSLAQTNHPLVVGASNFFRGLLGLGQAVPPPSSTPRPVSVTTTPRPVPTTTTPRPVPVTTTLLPVPVTTTLRPVPVTTTPRPVPVTTTPRPVPVTTTPRPVPGFPLAQTNLTSVFGPGGIFGALIGLG